jgi:hypothetical protein
MQLNGNYSSAMTLARALLVRLVVLAAMLAWTGGQLAASLHKLETIHVRCAEHGHVIEIELATVAAADHVHPQQDELRAAPDCQDHEQHCLHQLLPQTRLASAAAPPPLPALAHPASLFAARQHDARGPPLAYAPKTSPPATA